MGHLQKWDALGALSVKRVSPSHVRLNADVEVWLSLGTSAAWLFKAAPEFIPSLLGGAEREWL